MLNIARRMTRASSIVRSGDMRTIHYLRVSTKKQGQSGLGLEAQRASIASFCASRDCECLAEYIEIESGRKADRPELAKALHQAKLTGATLVIAKLDRLGRNVAFLSALQEAGVRFVCADMPEASELTLHIMAAMAQAEARAISVRTMDALAAAKARGVVLGNPIGAANFQGKAEAGRVAGVEAIKANAQSFAEEIRPIIAHIQEQGLTSFQQIADELNRRGIMTARSGQWHKMTVRNLLLRVQH